MLGCVCALVGFKWSGKELPMCDSTKRPCVLKRGNMLTIISVYQVPNHGLMIITADSIWRWMQKWRNPDHDLILYWIKTEHGFAVLVSFTRSFWKQNNFYCLSVACQSCFSDQSSLTNIWNSSFITGLMRGIWSEVIFGVYNREKVIIWTINGTVKSSLCLD